MPTERLGLVSAMSVSDVAVPVDLLVQAARDLHEFCQSHPTFVDNALNQRIKGVTAALKVYDGEDNWLLFFGGPDVSDEAKAIVAVLRPEAGL